MVRRTKLNTINGKKKIYFYRATGKYGFLSNLFKKALIFEDREFSTGEHAYIYGKIKDEEIKEWVMNAPKPHLVSIVGHGLFSWDIVENWSKIKVDRMYKVLRVKFSDEELRQKLLDTGDAILIENSKTDPFWGIGKKGNGKNMLGMLLMKVREEIRKCIKCTFYNDLLDECEAYIEDPLNCKEFKEHEEIKAELSLEGDIS